MKVDASKSAYHEDPSARHEYDKKELRRLRLLLRRLRFLEAKVRESGGLEDGGDSGGAAFAEWEIESLEWILRKMNYLTVSGNGGQS